MAHDLVPATGSLLEQILDQSYGLWGEGLTRADYARYNKAQLRMPWGTENLRRVALVDNGTLLSTAKRYQFAAHLDGRPFRLVGLGAVFTPPALRGQGYAGELISRVLGEAAGQDFDFAMLFSEISPAFYERFGFRSVPVEQQLLEVSKRPGAPAMLVRSGEDGDFPAIVAMHEDRRRPYRFSIERTVELVRFSIGKKRILAGLGPPGLRGVDFFVVEEGGQAVAYAVILRSSGTWTITEAGDRDPTGARLGALLQTLLARAPSSRLPSIRAWLPPGFLPPQMRILRREVPPVSMMLAPLGGARLDPPLASHEVMWWHGDAF